jgi:hypothetical protein
VQRPYAGVVFADERYIEASPGNGSNSVGRRPPCHLATVKSWYAAATTRPGLTAT